MSESGEELKTDEQNIDVIAEPSQEIKTFSEPRSIISGSRDALIAKHVTISKETAEHESGRAAHYAKLGATFTVSPKGSILAGGTRRKSGDSLSQHLSQVRANQMSPISKQDAANMDSLPSPSLSSSAHTSLKSTSLDVQVNESAVSVDPESQSVIADISEEHIESITVCKTVESIPAGTSEEPVVQSITSEEPVVQSITSEEPVVQSITS